MPVVPGLWEGWCERRCEEESFEREEDREGEEQVERGGENRWGRAVHQEGEPCIGHHRVKGVLSCVGGGACSQSQQSIGASS